MILPHLLLFGSLLGFSYQAETDRDLQIKVVSDLVVVDADVRDRTNGEVVFGLSRSDFVLYEDGVKQSVTHFSQDLWPLSVLLVVDSSGSTWADFEQLRRRLMDALRYLRPEDEVALMGTASRTELIHGFTRDHWRVAEALQSFHEGSLGDDGILVHDAVHAAAEYVRVAADPRKRRAIVFVTDDFGTQSRFKGRSERETLSEVFETDSTICAVIIRVVDPVSRQVIKYHPGHQILFHGSVATYVARTGGESIDSKNRDVEAKLAGVIHRLRNRYSLGYVSTNPKRDGGSRRIELKLTPEAQKRVHSAAVRFKRGYYARAAAAPANASPRN